LNRVGYCRFDVILPPEGLLDATDVQFEDEPSIEEALFMWKDTTADFADCLIGAKNRRMGCKATVYFDVKASKLPGFITT
jgi:predicted nucleic-acid-binding protein